MNSGPPLPILVTGGAGYVGAHACKELARRGYRPIVYDDLSQGHADAVRWGPLEIGDISDRGRLDEVIAQYRPIAVMHFAASSCVGESVADPGKYYRNNVAGTLSLLEAMRDHGIGRLVFSSSAAIYGTPMATTILEDAPNLPINPYGQTKLMAERMIADFAAAHDFSVVALRYFNAAGADPAGEIGECHEPESHLIPLALRALSRGGAPLHLFGVDYETPDGSCIRDYVHVTDLASAHALALERVLGEQVALTLNLGIGRGHSVREVIAAIERVTGLKVPSIVGPRREGDPPLLVANAAKAQETLGWSPEHSDLARIVETAWAWHCRAQ